VDTHTKNLVESTIGGLQGRRGQKVGTSIPGDILDTLELIRDFGNGNRDDGLVERDEKDGEVETQDDDRDSSKRGILLLWSGLCLL
jgi:hypothetical protein